MVLCTMHNCHVSNHNLNLTVVFISLSFLRLTVSHLRIRAWFILIPGFPFLIISAPACKETLFLLNKKKHFLTPCIEFRAFGFPDKKYERE